MASKPVKVARRSDLRQVRDLVLEPRDEGGLARAVGGARSVPGDGREVVLHVPLVAERGVHVALGGEVAEGGGVGEVGRLELDAGEERYFEKRMPVRRKTYR